MTERFGEFEGEPVDRITISDGTLTANVITWGAVVQDLRLAGHDAPLVLGFETFDPYPEESPYFGAIAGRVANRIRNARAPLNGRTVELDANVRGVHHLHGGRQGLGRKVWSISDRGPAHVTLEITSRDGDMGYPGTMTAHCTYKCEDGALAVHLDAKSDADTFCNLAHHSYFNLADGGRTPILAHQLRIAADAYLDTDDDFVAGGDPLRVDGTRFDFRTSRPIRVGGTGEHPIWDHNYCLARERGPIREAARVRSPDGSILMRVETTEPGLQFYAGHKIATETPGLEGIAYGPRSGLCLEAQVWPDAPNNPDYPSAVLHARNGYQQITRYAFSHG